MTSTDSHFELRGAAAVICLNRPAKRNALILALRNLFETLPAVAKAAVLHGEDDHFCAGLDLNELERDAGQSLHHSRMRHAVLDRTQFGPVPVVAALHGAVVGGGLELASARYIRVTADLTSVFLSAAVARCAFPS